MPADLHWDNTEDIGLLLADTYPDINPLEVRFTDLHRMTRGTLRKENWVIA